MEGKTDSNGTMEDAYRIVQELREDITEIYQYYHGDPVHLQKIFDKWVIEEEPDA